MKNQVIDQLVIVSADISCWSGMKVLDESDIAIGDGGKLPDNTAATKGSKFLVLPERLKTLRNFGTKVDNYLTKIGLKFGKVHLVPNTKLDLVLKELEAFDKEYQKIVEQFVANYPSYVQECAAKNEKEFANGDAIRAAAPSQSWIRNRFGFDIIHYKMNPGSASNEKNLVKQVTGLAGKLLSEIEDDAVVFLRDKHNQVKWGPKTLSPLKRWKEKLESLVFLDQRFSSLISLLDDAITAPSNNVSAYNRALAAASVMSNPAARDAYLDSGAWQQIYGASTFNSNIVQSNIFQLETSVAEVKLENLDVAQSVKPVASNHSLALDFF